MTKMTNNYYYDIARDLEKFPEAVFIFAIGGRNTGKTYSALKYCSIDNNITFGFIKRTIEDIKFLTQGGKVKTGNVSVDTSPFKSINRDFCTNIKALPLDKGFGGFFHCNEEGEAVGTPVGYALALNAVVQFKGFDLSDIDILIFDEFIPNIFERVSKNEGEQVLDLIKTITRDREHRGKPALKVIFLANATRVSNPIFDQFELIDTVAEMQALNREYLYLQDRQIFIHLIHNSYEFNQKEKESALYKCMHNTNWGAMAYDNQFGYDDFSDIEKRSLKGFRPVIKIIYKTNEFYIYVKDGFYYATDSKAKKPPYTFNLNKEADRRRFLDTWHYDLREKNANGFMSFKKYSYYDLIINFRKKFKF